MADCGAPPRMRWWGWGDPAHPPVLPAHALDWLRENVGLGARPRPAVALGQVRLPAPGAPQAALAALRQIVGAEHVRDGHAERVLHAAGKGYPDLVRLRAGEPEGAPDAIVYPAGHEQLRALLELCARPFARGGAVRRRHERRRRRRAAARRARGRDRARHEPHGARCSSSTSNPRRSGCRLASAGPSSSAGWRARGLTLGHFPQSFEYVSLGGCAATRSAGQASSRLRRDREDGAGPARWRRPPRRSRCRRCPRAPPDRGCASCWWARRARSG